MVRNPIHRKTVHKDLTRKLGKLIPDVIDELTNSIDDYWGIDTSEWRDITVFTDMMKIVSRASNRVFVGLPLCRNDDYLENARKFARDIPLTSGVFRLFPKILRPVVQWVVSIPTAWHCHKCFSHLLPLVENRIIENGKRESGETKEEGPNDFLSWHIQNLDQEPDQSERTPTKIAHRIMVVNFAAIHTSTFAATNILFDIFSTDPEERIVEQLREEPEQVLSQHGGQWSKESLAKLVKIDSAIRESMRISTFMIKGLQRMVKSPTGVTLQNGTHIPQGSTIGTPVYAIHHDNANYENAMKYDAFRFSRARESSSILEGKNLSIVTTNEAFLTFGHGSHSCPGRFFAAAELKLLLAYIILNYDVKPLLTRPPNKIIAANIIPPTSAKIEVRRRSA
ncbi:cytochrome P450 [Phlyctema vagabunda]|uniref:Cytochrome P450 n=1 Tax=Phlyctema vagabunda TaxID=108571 RepID=A0ABR4P5H8_9HELO